MQAGCGNGSLLAGDLVVRAKEASYTNDGSRPVQPPFFRVLVCTARTGVVRSRDPRRAWPFQECRRQHGLDQPCVSSYRDE